MPSYVIKQPNGLYAIFSTVVDEFTHMGHTRTGILREMAGRWAPDEAEAAVVRAEKDEPTGESLNTAAEHRRWLGALSTVRMVHGVIAHRIRREIGEASPGICPGPIHMIEQKTVGYVIRCGDGDYVRAVVDQDRIAILPGWTSKQRQAMRLSRSTARSLKVALRAVQSHGKVKVVRLVRRVD